MSLFSLDNKKTDIGTQSPSGSLFSLKSNPIQPKPAPEVHPVIANSILTALSALPKSEISQATGKEIPATDVRARFVAPVETLPKIERPGRVALDAFKNTSSDLYNRFDSLSQSITDANSTKADKLAKAASVGVGLINTIFAGTGIPAALAASEQIPGLAPVAKGVNNLFSTAGTVGGNAGSVLLDHLNISDATKQSLSPIVQEISGLLAQVAVGGIAHEAVKTEIGSLTKRANDIVMSDPNVKVAVESQTSENKIPVRTPDTNHADYAKSQGYEPYVAPENLPTIDVGRSSGELPSIQTETKPPSRLGSLTVEPIKTETAPAKIPSPFVPATEDLAKTSTTPTPTIDRPILDNGTRVSKAANDINQNLVEKGFQQLPPEDQAKYTTQTKIDQIKKVSDILTNEFDNARKMIKGEVPVPSGVNEQVLFNSMEKHAIKNGDAVLLRDLANSPIATRLSEHAQALGAHGYSDNPNSPVQAIKDITKAREIKGKSVKKIKSVDITDIKKEVKAIKAKKQTWSEFIKSVQC